MHYNAENPDHGMQYDPFKALVVPRPIGWISTLSNTGIANLAPFSFFNALSDKPPFLTASIANGKDSLNNLLETKECTVCVTGKAQIDAMNTSSASVATDINEFELANLAQAESKVVKPARVAHCPAAFECALWKSIPLPVNADTGLGYTTVILQVLSVFIDDKYIKDGKVDTAAMQPVARLGYMDYAVVENIFSLNRPTI